MSTLDDITIKTKIIDKFNFIFIDGKSLRENPSIYTKEISNILNNKNIIIVKNFIELQEVTNLIHTAQILNKNKPAIWKPYTNGCSDFHHYDYNSNEDDTRRIEEGRKIRPRRFHIYKFLPWNFRSEIFESIIKDIVNLRNNFYLESIDEEVMNIPQIVHYERGGDFLGEHKDLDFHKKQGLSTHVEIISLLSSKNKNFVNGGLFIRSSSKKIIMVEDYTSAGDLVLYDVRNAHGCMPIDSELIKDSNNYLGRWMLLIPPYKKKLHIKGANHS